MVKIPFTIDWDALELNSESSKPTSTGCPRGLRGWTQLPSAHIACVEISQLSFVCVRRAARSKRCIIIPVWGLGGQSCVATLALLASLHVLWPHRQAIAGRKESDSATCLMSASSIGGEASNSHGHSGRAVRASAFWADWVPTLFRIPQVSF